MKNKDAKPNEVNIKTRIIRWLTLIYLLAFAIMYVQTVVELRGNIKGLRAEHLDIPAYASDTVIQIKNIACLVIGLAMFIGFTGMLTRKRFGKTTAILGLSGQAIMYLLEMAIFGLDMFSYKPTIGVIPIILIDIALVYNIYRND